MKKGLEALKEIGKCMVQNCNYAEYYKEFDIIEKELKVLRLLKRINFDIVYREQFDEWTLFIVITTQDGEYLEPVTFGEGKDQYELLKKVML